MIEDELVALEHGFWEAAGDGDFYADHMHDHGRCLLPVGVLDKSSTIDAIARAEPWSSHEFDDIEVHEPGPEVAVLTYKSIATRTNSDDTYEALISTTYIRNSGSWQLLIHQQTPLMTQTE